MNVLLRLWSTRRIAKNKIKAHNANMIHRTQCQHGMYSQKLDYQLCLKNTKLSSFHMHCLPQNFKDRAVTKVVRFVERLSEGIRVTNAQGYLRSKHNSVFIHSKTHSNISFHSNKIVGVKQYFMIQHCLIKRFSQCWNC